ncbi:DUF1206 domain-containing protein [Nocardiopsis lambiniae]|uniref:DUF1206 domain-containing protein n=1 Tax=Nocardiopsis lambiniae TaxID=3075539 RepID=A0ABU2MCL8_9ACTN|nr:DUF1206 domain-containing protein [Nocardiopsis sp. DSM 44743]MDT0330310.1 DUF1206 domain-containing protein [Nocardiopsis sp. DSM 44743]
MNASSKARRSARKAKADGERAGRQAAHSRSLRILAGIGYAARGLIYLIIGYIALRIAFGDSGGEEADNSGALQIIAQGEVGTILLWVVAVGLAALTLWQVLLALLVKGDAKKRLAGAVRAATCAALTFAIVTFLLGRGAPESQDSQAESLTAQLMSLPFGRWLIALIGLTLIGVGCYQIWKGATRRFTRDLTFDGASRTVRTAVVWIGTAGIITHGLVLGTAGVFFVQAAWTFDEDEAQGLDGTLRSFSETPVGPYALVAVAVGVVLYGVYCFCQARWQRD